MLLFNFAKDRKFNLRLMRMMILRKMQTLLEVYVLDLGFLEMIICF